MSAVDIRGVSVKFPFSPYELQVNYMDKVIECLQTGQNGVLESPTGTGKTLSLLCSSLAWLEVKKAQVQAERLALGPIDLTKELEGAAGAVQNRGFLGAPMIIYASRTHTQLTQAMQELKRTKYNHMKAVVLGSREQMCVHEDILQERNRSIQIQLCHLKIKQRSCKYHNRNDTMKGNPALTDLNVVDIEDLVTLGKKHVFCPYYMAKDLKLEADIVFTPYNYLLDPKARRNFGLALRNNIVILDEAHNVEKTCEEAASMQIKSTDVTLCIDEITTVMKALSEGLGEEPTDFTADDLCDFKEILLRFEKALDGVQVQGDAGATFDGDYIFTLLEMAGITSQNDAQIYGLVDKLVQFLSVNSESPFARKGAGLQLFSDLISVAFSSKTPEFQNKMKECYKVHVVVEQNRRKNDNWMSKATASTCRVLSFWCFSPGFGMNMLVSQGVHSVILTSGTLAPLKPLIAEMELDVRVQIENPHIVKEDQICVKILSTGPDKQLLNCNYQNRDNPAYLQSLGITISNLIRHIPDGVLIFFPSYPMMKKCEEAWQSSGIWGAINSTKAVFMEPREKAAFSVAMTEYYTKIREKSGAIFMGVCRGKIAEGLDFADANGRAVFVIGLPYPPLKDPKVVLKKKYLDGCHRRDKSYLHGDDWYSLEAIKAVNQAIGRVIRHHNDFGAIILLDSRFKGARVLSNLSLWLREFVKAETSWPPVVQSLRAFFLNAAGKFAEVAPPPPPAVVKPPEESAPGLVTIHKRSGAFNAPNGKRKKLVVVPNQAPATSMGDSIREYIAIVKSSLDPDSFSQFLSVMTTYRESHHYEGLEQGLKGIFRDKLHLAYLIGGLSVYVQHSHMTDFQSFCRQMELRFTK